MGQGTIFEEPEDETLPGMDMPASIRELEE
jgi:hypothetical protein